MMTDAARAVTGDAGRRAIRARAIDLAGRYAAAATTLAVLLFAAAVTPSFYRPGNLYSVAIQAAVLGVVVVGQTLVLLIRGLDMSVSAVMGLSAAIVVASATGASSMRMLLLAAVIAVAVGLANGLLVTKRNVPPFIATFAMLILVGGARLAYTHGQTSGSVPSWVRALGSGAVLGVPLALITWVALGLAAFVMLRFTVWGRWVYAAGTNPEAARHSGVPVDRVVVAAFVLASLCALLGGLMLSGFLGYVDQGLGVDANLNSIAAAIIGGVAFSGGRGGVLGAAIGALLLTILVNVVVVAGLAVHWEYVVEGAVLVVAVTIQGLRDRWVSAGS